MKARIFFTKFWTDSYIRDLERDERELFLYLITNDRVDICDVYELPHWLICQTIQQKPKRVDEIKAKFEKDGKFAFRGDWVYGKNFSKYQTFKGEKNEIAKQKAIKSVPETILKELGYPIDGVFGVANTPSNKYSVISNKKEGGVGEKQKVGRDLILSATQLTDLKSEFPNVDIEFELDNARDWLKANGKVKKDYLAFARYWLRKAVKDEQKGGFSDGRKGKYLPPSQWHPPFRVKE